MSDLLDPLARAQLDAAARLRSRLVFAEAGVMVQLMRPRSAAEATAIVGKINDALQGLLTESARSGLSIMVPLPSFKVTAPNLPFIMGEIALRIVVMENIAINEGESGTGITCEGAALLIQDALHDFMLEDSRRVTCVGMEPLDVADQEFVADIAYEITFTAPLGYQRQAECDQPLIVNASGNLTFTTATAGASLLITLDGSLPAPGAPGCVPAPSGFVMPLGLSGTIVRCVAVKPGINPSLPARIVIP